MQEEVLFVQPVHERTQRDKGVVPVEEVSGLVPPRFHELVHSTTAIHFFVLDVVLFYLPPNVRKLLYSLSH